MTFAAETPWLAEAAESKSAEDLLRWALDRFHPRIVFASSFGADDVVVIHMLARIRRDVRIFTLDTGRLPEETYEVMESIRNRYGVVFETHFPDKHKVERLEREKGFYSFRETLENRKECCRIRKVEPLGAALSGLDAWITGLRREQAVTRDGTAKLERDESHPGLWKLNPIADWTLGQVWAFIREHQIPYNALHDRGFTSIGCAPCTRAVRPGEDVRAGRWWWELPEQKECGLHSVHPTPPPD
ncbi:MAG TPA: phosphoadenylyl-sulfate reductase [Candidatus Polarisedimenticolia bacterium]|nr:phosphoadenylyl-sulfate reductase [Candidatus Polarisedimenticolia bacterium]